jgi:hypothetical protein
MFRLSAYDPVALTIMSLGVLLVAVMAFAF